MAHFLTYYPNTARAIRAFRGPADATLRCMIRNALQANQDVRTIARTVALTPQGTAKLQAVWEAWEAESPVLAGPDSGAGRRAAS